MAFVWERDAGWPSTQSLSRLLLTMHLCYKPFMAKWRDRFRRRKKGAASTSESTGKIGQTKDPEQAPALQPNYDDAYAKAAPQSSQRTSPPPPRPNQQPRPIAQPRQVARPAPQPRPLQQ